MRRPVTIHKFCSMLPAFVFQVHPVPVEDAFRANLMSSLGATD
jgi:hypothetical protein